MDFFAHQDRARRQTTLMVVLFLISVVLIVLAINLVGGAIFIAMADLPPFPLGTAFASVPRSAWWITTAVVLCIITAGTLTRLYALSGGGAAVAEMVGARRVPRDTREPGERRLINIIEEMAIASGINVPHIFVMDGQDQINAFAAGYSPNEAAITVTRGALERLSRDELQGVIAHEYSHVLNGDMRLNIRLMGVIAGMVMIGTLGRFLMRLGGGGGNDGDSGGRSKGDLRILVVGLAIWAIGSIGVLFGNLIKAAIARQREYLADASSVQFTRNPEGIGSALHKIGLHGSGVTERHAEEFSHMYFGEPVVTSLFATHPPLDERITRILGPGGRLILNDRMKRTAATQATASASEDSSANGALGSTPPVAVASGLAGAAEAGAFMASGMATGQLANRMMASIGTLKPQQVDHARRLLDSLPEPVRSAMRTDSGAQAALLALLLNQGEVRQQQLEHIRSALGSRVAAEADTLAQALAPIGLRARLPVFELAAPTLGSLDEAERARMLALVSSMIDADSRVTPGEFVLLTLCRRHLGTPPRGAPPVKHQNLSGLGREAATVLALLARCAPGGQAAAAGVMAALGLPPALLQSASITPGSVEAAFYELKLLAPLRKPAFIKGCLEVVLADGRITLTEGELMRAICAALDSPMPPLIEDMSGWTT